MKTKYFAKITVLFLIFLIPVVFGFKASGLLNRENTVIDTLTQIRFAEALYEEFEGDLLIVETDKDKYKETEPIFIVGRYNNVGDTQENLLAPYLFIRTVSSAGPIEYSGGAMEPINPESWPYDMGQGSQAIAHHTVPANTLEPGLKEVVIQALGNGSHMEASKIIKVREPVHHTEKINIEEE